ncbi:MAG: hypothetical protein ACOZF0_09315 [Thermodesulfobacteriota bacterium]
MKIISSDIRLEADHQYQREEVVGLADRQRSSSLPAAGQPTADRVTLSRAAKNHYQSEQAFALFARQQVANIPERENQRGDPATGRLIKVMTQALSGREVRIKETMSRTGVVSGPVAGSSPATAGVSGNGGQVTVRFFEVRTLLENETANLISSGVIRTGDGTEITFDLQLQLVRAFQSRETNLRQMTLGAVTDPLVVTLDGGPPRITETFFTFDLNSDGLAEEVAALGPGSGFLALDRNGDGQINNGAELFGPRSGDGFLELALHDQDGNRWIDENDPIYSQLSVWQQGANGQNSLMSLKAAGIGAIHLQAADTPFAMTDGQNRLFGQLRKTGIMVKEEGVVQQIYQVDLVQREAPTGLAQGKEPGSQGNLIAMFPARTQGPTAVPGRSFVAGVPAASSSEGPEQPGESMLEAMKKRFERLKDEIEKMQQETMKKAKAAAARAADAHQRYAPPGRIQAASYPAYPREKHGW